MTTWTASNQIPIPGAVLNAEWLVPPGATGIVIVVRSADPWLGDVQYQAIAEACSSRHLAVVRVDLAPVAGQTASVVGQTASVAGQTAAVVGQTAAGDRPGDQEPRFELGPLTDRLIGLLDWLSGQRETANLPVGLFAAGAGGAVALVGAAARVEPVRAVVTWNGRPDLVGPALVEVNAPTLMIVGECETAENDLNQQARTMMKATVEVRTITETRHVFEHPRVTEQLAGQASAWFAEHLAPVGARGRAHHPAHPG